MFLIRRILFWFILLHFFNSSILGFHPIDLNSASFEDLIKIPGIGKVIAKNIIEYREKHGPFTSVEELLKVKGIGPKKLNQIKPYLMISNFPSKKSLNFSNTSSSIYFYKDEKGVIHYTQFPESVPSKYKNSLKKVE
ncbi:MAG: helix-hairpin-helix domain-containing protein [Thermodesulfobacteriaceae bacterium]|nr:helix-hairpin-helix domain-containing protein [Thermodesulfobacteriaceae bacterium]MCX8041749.1 helix-hairpin-helix domain-containing protein [Thermodesulfobacteriaceae bacterium]MDW8136296.1 helix-hairpin-helix domain-containing protein [Thermodesulfobacterium sp.]